jgi:hypothetical protein
MLLYANKSVSRADIEAFVYKWNLNYPIDRWWREKHKIRFNSPEHRVVSFLDIYTEWIEDRIYEKERDAATKNFSYKPGDWLTEREADKADIQDEIKMFEGLDLSKMDDNGR